jgi:hypothetical protein
VSFYYEKNFDRSEEEDKSKLFDGIVLSRPSKMYYKFSSYSEMYKELPLYNIDIMCVNKSRDKKKISRELLQTHEYNQRNKSKNIEVSIIKKEIDLFDGVIPLTEYSTYVYHLKNIHFPKLPSRFHILNITSENIDIVTEFLYLQSHTDLSNSKKLFNIIVLLDSGAYIKQIKEKQLFVYCLRCEEEIYGIYFFKDAKMQYEDIEGNTLQCISSVMNCNSINLFYLGFLYSMQEIIKGSRDYKILLIENIAHNNFILENWMKSNAAVFINDTAYYSYNFIYPSSPVTSNNCLIVQ